MITQTIDGISFSLLEPSDFSFLSQYGEVFCVFDQNDSGNISFGLKDGNEKRFIKIAGAKTLQSCITANAAIELLKAAMPTYETLKHPNLIELINHYRHEHLYIAVFKWAEGDCLFDHWNFDAYKINRHLNPPYMKFKELPIEKRLHSVNAIFEFLIHTESKGYIAVDFYDGSIMYDFQKNTTTICDIDFFRKQPAMNETGEDFWGSKRMKAPEEYVYGATIDSITNVYTLGALLFYFFGSYSSTDISQMCNSNCFFPCEAGKWELGNDAYDICLKAVQKDRTKRYGSISHFYGAWNDVLEKVKRCQELR